MPHQCTACGHTFEDGSKEMLSGCPGCGGTTFQFTPSGSSGGGSSADPGEDAADERVPDEAPSPTPPERDGGGVAERMGRTATAMRDWMATDDDPPGSGGATDADADRPTASTAWPDPPDVSHVRQGGTDRRDTARRPPATDTDEDAGADARENAGAHEDAGADAGRDTGTDADAPTPDEDGLIVADEHEPAAEDTAQASARSEMARPDELPPRTDPDEGRVVSEPSGEKPDMAELRAELNEQFESIKILEPGQYELNLMELYDREEYIIALQENGRYVIQMPEDWLGDRGDRGDRDE
jgi:predicted  nucleic acid-binding Zn-ribbon protein